MGKRSKTTTAEALLGMLSLRAMSGYELRQAIESSIGNFWSESFGQIYPTLKRLERDGFVSADEGGRAGSKVYSLTESGRERLGRWLEVMPQPQVPRNELLLKLFFGNLLPPERLSEQVAGWRRGLVAELTLYQARAAELSKRMAGRPGLPFWLMTLRHGELRTKALIEWCDETLAQLEAMARLKDESAFEEVTR